MTLLTRLANRLTEMDGKSETIKQLAAYFNCPHTSLYIPIRQLEDAGFLKLKKGSGVIVYGSTKKEPETVQGNEAEKGVCECSGVVHVSTDKDNVTWCLSCKRKVD